MFRITSDIRHGEIVLKLEGCLEGPWVRELEVCWRETAGREPDRRIRMDLTDVCHVDRCGQELMTAMYRAGVRYVARGCAMPELVREIAQCANGARETRS